MAKFAIFLPIRSLLLLILLSTKSGGLKVVKAEEDTWSVAKPSTHEAQLQAIIDFACGSKVINCVIIQPGPGGFCFEPNTLINHASVAMNQYYKFYGENPWNCDFNNAGLITLTNPSYDFCNY